MPPVRSRFSSNATENKATHSFDFRLSAEMSFTNCFGGAILAERLECGGHEYRILAIELNRQSTEHLVQRCLSASLLRPAIPGGGERQQENRRKSPTHATLPNTRRGLLVGALSLRFRQRLGLFQLTFLRYPFGFGSLALLLQLRSVRRLAIAEKCAGLVEARAVPLGPRRVGRFALLPLPGVGEVGLAPQAGLAGPPAAAPPRRAADTWRVTRPPRPPRSAAAPIGESGSRGRYR